MSWRIALLVLVLTACAASSSSLSVQAPQAVVLQHQAVSTHSDIVIDTHQPHFSWQLVPDDAEQRGVIQAAYQLQLRTVDEQLRRGAERLYWDSGIVATNSSRHQRYNGPALASDTSYSWRLRYWTAGGQQSDWAEGRFRSALFRPAEDFQGRWIGHERVVMNELRKEFPVAASLSRATVFLAVAGYYELYFNGQQVDPTRRLDPGYTLYEKDLLYVSFDATDRLQASSGASAAVGIRLGAGWYSQQQNPPGFGTSHPTYGPPRLLFQLNLQTADGEVVSVVSDETWTGREGAITASSPYMGERYSALKERPGWSETNFSDPSSLWLPAMLLPSPLANTSSEVGGLRLQSFDPIRAGDAALHVATSRALFADAHHGLLGADLAASRGVLHPVVSSNPSFGVLFYDLGQNSAATCTVTLQRVAATVQLDFQHAEILQQPGANGRQYQILDMSNLRGAVSTDEYIAKGGEGNETYTPAFTVHGFRYFTIKGIYDGGQVRDVTCYAIHSETTLIGQFTSSNAVINQIQHNVQWGQLSNLMSIPTDCDQRDERRGWMGDAGLSVDEALFNFDFAGFYLSWLQQIALDQDEDGSVGDIVPDDGGNRPADPNWGSAYPTVVWQLWDHYGDVSVLQLHYEGVRGWIECMHGRYNRTGLAQLYYYYGDWEPPAPYGMTDQHLTASFAFLSDLHRVMDMAAVLNLTEDAARYQQLYSQLAAEFHSTFYHDAIKGYGDGQQASNVFALWLPEVVPANLTAAVLKSLVSDITTKGHFTTGCLAIARMLPLLSMRGQHDLAVSLVQQTTYPSYGWTFNNRWENATTLWEQFDAPTTDSGPSMASRNHHMYASVGSWFYRYLGGINVNAFSPIILRPRMTRDAALLPRVTAEVVTLAGPVRVQYERVSADSLEMAVTVPHNTRARLTLEALVPGGRCLKLTESEQPVLARARGLSAAELQLFAVDGISELREREDDHHNVEMMLGSGSYSFRAVWGLAADNAR